MGLQEEKDHKWWTWFILWKGIALVNGEFSSMDIKLIWFQQ
jgi:hypothetical protein